METMRRLSGLKCTHDTWLISSASYSWLCTNAGRHKNLQHLRFSTSLSSNSSCSRGHQQNSNHNTLRNVWVSLHVIRLMQRCTNFSAIHRWSIARLRFLLRIHRRYISRIKVRGRTSPTSTNPFQQTSRIRCSYQPIKMHLWPIQN